MKTKVTHVKKQKIEFESNQQFIQSLGISDVEYKNLMLEVGCEFLEELFPRNEQEYETWYKEIAYSKTFWNWWKVEWNSWLSYLIKRGAVELKTAFPWSMRLVKTKYGTNKSFQDQYLKLIHNAQTRL